MILRQIYYELLHYELLDVVLVNPTGEHEADFGSSDYPKPY